MKLFPVLSCMLAVLVLLVGSGCAQPASEPSGNETPSVATETPSADTEGELTVGTTEGPYYVTGTALLEDGNLNYTTLPGEKVRVVGRVFGGTGDSKPLVGAKVELWQADDAGSYHPNANGPASSYDDSEIALRGYVVTGEDGSYAFDTIYPGQYPGRTRHIHVLVSAEGYGGVATQIIVPAKSGDSTTPENDAIAKSLPAVNHVTFSDRDGIQTATFDMHLGAD